MTKAGHEYLGTFPQCDEIGKIAAGVEGKSSKAVLIEA